MHWTLANGFGIWPDQDGDWSSDSFAATWQTGRTNDVLVLDDGGLLVASDNGGVWRLSAGGGYPLPVSNNWAHANFNSLAFGYVDPKQIYAGGASLYVTDLTQAVPILNWVEIDSYRKKYPAGGAINQIAVLRHAPVIVLACDGGIFWSRLPANAAISADYVWHRGVFNSPPGGGCASVAVGPLQRLRSPVSDFDIMESLMVGGGLSTRPTGVSARGLFFGWWSNPDELHFSKATLLKDGAPMDPTMDRVVIDAWPPDRQIAYAACTDATPSDDSKEDADPPEPADQSKLLDIARTDDGGRTWNFLNATSLVRDDKTGEARQVPLQEVLGKQGRYDSCIAVSPVDPGIVAVGFQGGAISFDNGRRWTELAHQIRLGGKPPAPESRNPLHADFHGLRFSPTQGGSPDAVKGRELFAATDGGVAALRWGEGAWVIETDLVAGGHGSLVAVVLEGTTLRLYLRAASTGVWTRRSAITTRATGAGCIIQSDFKSGIDDDHRNYEVVVLEGNELVHYWGQWSGHGIDWFRGQTISTQVTGPACIIQSDYPEDADHHNFEVVALEGNELVHYWHDNADVALPWQRGPVITAKATGPACLIQSDYVKGASHGNFEVVVLEGSNLVHYYRDNNSGGVPWSGGWVITNKATGPGCIFRGDYPLGADHYNFELIAPEGPVLAHWMRDNQNGALPWIRIATITAPTSAASGPGCAFQGNYGNDANHGNFELLAVEGAEVVHYWRDNAQDAAKPWFRSVVVAGPALSIQTSFNRRLPILEFYGPAGANLHYGTSGACAAIDGLIAGGTQDNGVVYGLSVEQSPWFRIVQGDGFVATFLSGMDRNGQKLPTAMTLVTNGVSNPGPFAADWDPGSLRLKPAHPNPENAFKPFPIPIGGQKPALPPLSAGAGLKNARVEPVTAPRFAKNGLMVAVGAIGPDVYGLFTDGPPGDQGSPPMRWDYLGSVTGLSLDPTSITALASLDGGSVLLAAADNNPAPGPGLIARFFTLNSATQAATQMAAKFWPGSVGGFAIASETEAYAVAGFRVMRWNGAIWADATPPGSGPFRAVAVDSTTNPTTVFVASVREVFVSRDGGLSWTLEISGLPKAVDCSDLRWVPVGRSARIYLSTYGRSMWVAEREAGW